MGTRIAALAGESGTDTVLAGRSATRLRAEAARLNMPWRSYTVAHPDDLDAMLADVQIVVNTAGPFIHTAPALIRACIRNHCHYLDLSNEVAIFQDVWTLDKAAREAGICLVPGVGFGTVAAEALATHLLGRINKPDRLTIVRTSGHGPRTPGVKRTMLEILAQPGTGLTDGRWSTQGFRITGFDLPGGLRTGVPVALGDTFATARATGIRNVTAYSTIRMKPTLARIIIPIIRPLARAGKNAPLLPPCNRRKASPPNTEETQIWMQAANPYHETATSYLQIENAGQLAAHFALQAVRQLQMRTAPGVLTAGQLIAAHNVPNQADILQIIDL